PNPTRATTANSNGHRVLRIKSLRTSVTVWKPISGRKSPKESSAATPASRRARAVSTRLAGVSLAMSDFLDIRAAKQTLRQEYQRDREDGESGDILVVDGKVRGPHRHNKADQNAAYDCARQRADAT